MKRRSFLAALFAAPFISAAIKAANPSINLDGSKIDAHGRSNEVPMVFENGVLKLQTANLGQVTGGSIRSANGRMVIDLTNGVMSLNG